MDKGSESHLLHVHPDLVKVMEAAAQTPQPFIVIAGQRTVTAEVDNVIAGTSKTMHSRHIIANNKNGYCCAVDVAALDEHGNVNWASGNEAQVYGSIAEQVLLAAKNLDIPLQWGGADIGAWTPGVKSTFKDWGHFQLPWKEYP